MKDSLKFLALLTKYFPVSDNKHHSITLTDDGLYIMVGIWVNDKCYPCTLDQEDLEKNVNVLVQEIKEFLGDIKENTIE